MDKEKALALYFKGRDAWNSWANSCLQEKVKLQAVGGSPIEWGIEAAVDFSDVGLRSFNGSGFIFPGAANFSATKFLDDADFGDAQFLGAVSFARAKQAGKARFENVTFNDTVDFAGAKFGERTNFSGAQFRKKAAFDSIHFQEAEFFDVQFFDEVHFERAEFAKHVSFRQVQFMKDATFEEARLLESAQFDNVRFHDDVVFSGARFADTAVWFGAQFKGTSYFPYAEFAGAAQFRSVTFFGPCDFFATRFLGTASFRKAAFSKSVRFKEVEFAKGCGFSFAEFEDDTSFRYSKFNAPSTFASSRFHKRSDFGAIQVQSAFSLENAYFAEVPDFIQAHFLEAPRLDNVEVPRITTWDSLLSASDPDAAPRYRALKRLALLGHDHDREQRFFADEVRSLRGNPDRPWPNLRNLFHRHAEVWPGGARYWFGILYEVLSNFGRSIPRPLVLWMLTIVLFGEAYFARHFHLSASPSCANGGGSAVRSAAYLAVRKALIFPSLSSDQKLDQAYACLYGTTNLAGSANGYSAAIPIIPDSVAYLSIAQTLVSAILIFLFLLAVRNHFRIK